MIENKRWDDQKQWYDVRKQRYDYWIFDNNEETQIINKENNMKL